MQEGGAAQPLVDVAFETSLVIVNFPVGLLNLFKLVGAYPAPEAEAQRAGSGQLDGPVRDPKTIG